MKQQLINYIRSGQPCLYFVTHEEMRSLALWREVAAEAGQRIKFRLFRWTYSQGVVCTEPGVNESGEAVAEPMVRCGDFEIPKEGVRIVNPVGTEPLDLGGMMDIFAALPGCERPDDTEGSILLAFDFHLFLGNPDRGEGTNPLLLRRLKDTIALGKATNRVLVIVGCRQVIPPELAKDIVTVEMKLPTREELNPVLEGIAQSAGIQLISPDRECPFWVKHRWS